MFDPERDEEPGARGFYLRLLAVAAVTALACVALWPSVRGFAAGPDHLTGCLAITDGWHADKSPPSDAALAAAYAVMPPAPTRDQYRDPEFMAHWKVQWRAAQSDPAVVQANAAIDWAGGPGACVPASRHRLIVSGIGLGALAAVLIVGGLIVRRTRPSLRSEPAEIAGA